MKVTGSAILSAPRDRVWAALNDPAVLVRTIPGCQRLETVGPDDYRMTVSAGVASIKGVYDGEVRISDQRPPEAFVLKARGAGGPGTVDATVRVTLAEDGSRTEVSYDADAIVGGMVAGVGQRMLTAVAKRTAGEFFASVDDVLADRAPAGQAAQLPESFGAGQPVATQTPGGAVYVAPPKVRQHASPALILGSAVVGAVIALVGVWIGWALGS